MYNNDDFYYFSLVRKADNKEVYTSPAYESASSDHMGRFERLDKERICQTLEYYFKRVNGAVSQQRQNPKLTDEQRAGLKYIYAGDYVINYTKFAPIGIAKKIFWTEEAQNWLRDYSEWISTVDLNVFSYKTREFPGFV